MEQSKLLESNLLLDRSIRNRFPYLDPLNHVQVELLNLHRSRAASEKVLTGISAHHQRHLSRPEKQRVSSRVCFPHPARSSPPQWSPAPDGALWRRPRLSVSQHLVASVSAQAMSKASSAAVVLGWIRAAFRFHAFVRCWKNDPFQRTDHPEFLLHQTRPPGHPNKQQEYLAI